MIRRRPASRSASGSRTSCTERWSNRHTTIKSAASTASSAVCAPRAPRAARVAVLSGLRFQTVVGWPAAMTARLPTLTGATSGVDKRRRLVGAAVPDGRGVTRGQASAGEGGAHLTNSEETHRVLCGRHATILQVTRSFRQVPTIKCDTYLLETIGPELQRVIR